MCSRAQDASRKRLKTTHGGLPRLQKDREHVEKRRRQGLIRGVQHRESTQRGPLLAGGRPWHNGSSRDPPGGRQGLWQGSATLVAGSGCLDGGGCEGVLAAAHPSDAPPFISFLIRASVPIRARSHGLLWLEVQSPLQALRNGYGWRNCVRNMLHYQPCCWTRAAQGARLCCMKTDVEIHLSAN